MKYSLVLLIILLCSSCAVPLRSEMKSEIDGFNLPVKAPAGYATVFLIRPSVKTYFNNTSVYVNSKEKSAKVAMNSGREYVYFFVRPGNYQIFSKIDNWSKISIKIKENETIFLKQQISSVFITTSNTLVKIDEIEGRYYVKNLSVGKIVKEKFN